MKCRFGIKTTCWQQTLRLLFLFPLHLKFNWNWIGNGEIPTQWTWKKSRSGVMIKFHLELSILSTIDLTLHSSICRFRDSAVNRNLRRNRIAYHPFWRCMEIAWWNFGIQDATIVSCEREIQREWKQVRVREIVGENRNESKRKTLQQWIVKNTLAYINTKRSKAIVMYTLCDICFCSWWLMV